MLEHPATRIVARELCATLDIEPTIAGVYEAVAFNDILCAGFARLLLWTLPQALSGPNEPSAGWDCYVDAWRPGTPRPETWEPFFAEAWEMVLGHAPEEQVNA